MLCSRVLTMIPVAALAGDIPLMKLNNGVSLPQIALGTVFRSDAEAEDAVKAAFSVGMMHIDTAYNYHIQQGVGAAVKGLERSSFFVTTKVPTNHATTTYDDVTRYMQADLEQLGLDHVDLMLLHYPPTGQNCKAIQEHWRAAEDFYKAGKAKAIGVSNYCQPSLDCLLASAEVVPAVNQLQFHVGMGSDPAGLKTYTESKGILHMAYSPLGSGTSELITGDLVSSVGEAHNKTGAQASLRWVVERNSMLTVKSASAAHLAADTEIFDFKLTDDELTRLDAATSPAGEPSNTCKAGFAEVV